MKLSKTQKLQLLFALSSAKRANNYRGQEVTISEILYAKGIFLPSTTFPLITPT